MLNPIVTAYFSSDLSQVSNFLPLEVKNAFELHIKGDLSASYEINQNIQLNSIKDEKLRKLLVADRIWLAVKIGLGLPQNIPADILRDRDTRVIVAYAKYTHYFWIDHKLAWRELIRLLIYSTMSSCPYFGITSLFLIGHMLCIGGYTFVGFPIAKAAFKSALKKRRQWKWTFATDIIVSTYNYTLFVSAKHKEWNILSTTLSSLLSNDPYYQTLFNITALYFHGYGGDIAQSEFYAHKLVELNEKGKLLRYKPLSKIMFLLPMALRGYGHIIEPKFAETVLSHNAQSSDTMINAHFFRAAALISLCLARKREARKYIELAKQYRLKSNSFRAWDRIDNRIKYLAEKQAEFNPTKEPILALKAIDVPPQLASVLIQIIAIVSKGVIDPSGFYEEIRVILCHHFGCEVSRIVNQLHDIPSKNPTLKLGNRFIVFENVDTQRQNAIWGMINSIAPSISELDSSINKMREFMCRLKTAESDAAIAKTTQMLAHDVRKPFSLLQMMLANLQKAKTISDMKEMTNTFVPEVQKAMTSVNGMITDVMETGRSAPPESELVSPESIIESSLSEVCRINMEAAIVFEYNFKHVHMLWVDPLKVGRVLSNILNNAIQAMTGQGRIWIRTIEEDGMVMFCLGNNGSFIAEEDLSHIFEAFFTKKKKSGTGLGLAIAKKVIEAHGGKIWCKSSCENQTVEFFFTLPVDSDTPTSTTAKLPANATALIDAYQKNLKRHHDGDHESTDNASSKISLDELEQRIVEYTGKIGRPLKVAIIDDEAIYRNALRALIRISENLKENVTTALFSSSKEFFDTADQYDYLICDIDLGSDSMNGYEIVKALRNSGSNTAICIHSNRSLPEDYQRSVEVGAQAFLPKPLSQFHLTKFMATIIEPIDTQQAPLNGQLTAGKGKKTATFALVDDSKIVLITWEQAWPLGTLHVFASPEEFWAYEENNIGFLDELTGLISDFNFAKGAIQNGVDFARDVRAKAPHLPIVLASNVDSECEEIEKGLFVGRLKKDIPKAEAVLEAFKFDFRDLEVLT